MEDSVISWLFLFVFTVIATVRVIKAVCADQPKEKEIYIKNWSVMF